MQATLRPANRAGPLRIAGRTQAAKFAHVECWHLWFWGEMRLKFATAFPVNPWVSAGGGLAHFNPSSTNNAGGPSGATSTTKGAFQVGAGLDFKAPAFPIALRVEAREFYAGAPNTGLPKLDLHHNVFIGGGIVLRF